MLHLTCPTLILCFSQVMAGSLTMSKESVMCHRELGYRDTIYIV